MRNVKNNMEETTMKKGFTIIEALVSCIILGIGVIALVRLFPTSVVINTRADRLSSAILIAEDKIEQFRATPFDTLENLISTGYNTGTDSIGHIIREWTLTSMENVIQVDINCSWRTPGSPGYSTTRLITQISKHE